MLVEFGLVEQRFAAVMEVINDGQPVTDVARRFGVSRQTVHRWLRRYASGGVAGLVDGSPKPDTCPHQMLPVVEAMLLSCGWITRGGVLGRCCSSWRRRVWIRCRAGRRCVGV